MPQARLDKDSLARCMLGPLDAHVLQVNVLVQSGNTSEATVLASASDSDGVATIRSYGL